MMMSPGIVATLNVSAPLMHTIGDPSRTGPAMKPSEPVLVTNFPVTTTSRIWLGFPCLRYLLR